MPNKTFLKAINKLGIKIYFNEVYFRDHKALLSIIKDIINKQLTI